MMQIWPKAQQKPAHKGEKKKPPVASWLPLALHRTRLEPAAGNGGGRGGRKGRARRHSHAPYPSALSPWLCGAARAWPARARLRPTQPWRPAPGVPALAGGGTVWLRLAACAWALKVEPLKQGEHSRNLRFRFRLVITKFYPKDFKTSISAHYVERLYFW